MSARTCPDCRTFLYPETVQGVQIDTCPQCAGVWFDDGELTNLQDRGLLSQVDEMVLPSMERRKGAAARLCPACSDIQLDEYAYMYSTPVRIDACPTCYGIWVQDGELRAMEALANRARTEPLPKDMGARMALAEAESEHENEMSRQRSFQFAMKVFTRRRPSIFW